MTRERGVVLATVLLAVAPRTLAEEPGVAEVRKREAARIQAMLKPDVATLEDVLSDDLTYTHSSGQVESKREFIDSIRSGRLQYRSFEREGVAVRVYGDAAVVTGRGHIQVRSGDADLEVHVQFTDVYVKRDSKWRMVAWQSTRLPEK